MNVKILSKIFECSEDTILDDLEAIRMDLPAFALDKYGKNEMSSEEYPYYAIMRNKTKETRNRRKGVEEMKYRMYKDHARRLPQDFGLTMLINRVDDLLLRNK